jgi:integrase
MGRAIDPAQVAVVEAAVARDLDSSVTGRRRFALAAALGLCGLRWCEVARLRVHDVSPAGTVCVRPVKGGRRRVVRVGPGLAGRLLRLGDARVAAVRCRGAGVNVGGVLLFCGRCGRVPSKQYVQAEARRFFRRVLGAPCYTFHCLRHTAAARAWLATRDLVACQRFLGHRWLSSTEVYLASLLPCGEVPLPSCAGGVLGGPAVALFNPDGLPVRRLRPVPAA